MGVGAVSFEAAGTVSHRPIDAEEPLAGVGGSFQAAPHALTSWAMHARAGLVCIYARVPRLAAGGVGERARQLQAMGLVRLLPQRGAGAGLFEYRCQRTALDFANANPVPDREGLRGEALMLLELLEALAEQGRACPQDSQLAALLGMRRREQVQQRLYDLKRRHLIRWEMAGFGAELVRVVTIVATGARTAA